MKRFEVWKKEAWFRRFLSRRPWIKAMPRILEVQDLEVRFQTPQGVVNAVNKVSFHVDGEEVLGIAGESGCGKSVTCQAIMGLVSRPGRIMGGKVLFGGEDLLAKSDEELRHVRSTGIAMVFQDPLTFLNPVLTVGDQVEEPLRIHLKLDRKQARARAIQLLAMVGIPSPEECLRAYPHVFSGGMRQRVMIAMALSCNPRLLIADEPTTALDVTVQLQIIDLVKRLRREIGMSVIWITHDLGVLAGIADRVNVMYAGHLVESSGVNELYADPRHPYSEGLLLSIPRMDKGCAGELSSISGNPPDLTRLGTGCPFLPRCGRSTARCEREVPPLTSLSQGRRVACWQAASREKEGENP